MSAFGSGLARTTALATLGIVIDWYDFLVTAAIAALVVPRLFFPPDAPRELALAASLALTVLTGNVARPLGALLFGHLGTGWGGRWVWCGTWPWWAAGPWG